MKHLNWNSKIFLLMAISIYCIATFWIFWPYTPIIMHDIKIMNRGNKIIAGETLTYEVNYTKNSMYEVDAVIRQLIDGIVITFAPVQFTRLPIGSHKVRFKIQIPENSYPGEYTLHIAARYQVNPIRTVTVSAHSKPFKIINKLLEE